MVWLSANSVLRQRCKNQEVVQMWFILQKGLLMLIKILLMVKMSILQNVLLSLISFYKSLVIVFVSSKISKD